jgi:membrane fusion protein, multidrug efflux system
MKRAIMIMLGLTLVLGFSACTSEKKEAKSMAQIYQDEGVPVRIVTVTPKEFKTVLSFNAVLTGIKESTAYAAMGDKVEKILVRVGDTVKKDQVLVTFPTDSPSARYFQAKVAYENAKTTFERLNGLYKSGGISLQERDNARTAYEVAKADWDSVRQMVLVKAPIGGTVTKIHAAETDNVDEEMPLVTIADTRQLKATIWIAESEILQVEEGMPAMAAWMGNRCEGKIVQVDTAMNSTNKAFRGLVQFANPDHLLKAGTTVNITVTTYNRPDAMVVERKDIFKAADHFFVYVVENSKAKKQNVILGRQQGLDVEVTAGLQPGDQLVVEGQLLLEDGSKVNVVK